MASELVPISRNLLNRVTKWRLCMSYNDSYFSEPEGELKRAVGDIERAVHQFDFPPKGQARDPETELNNLVNRFLAWPIPQSVCSDGCVTNSAYALPRSGTNLLNADEAKQMIRYLLEAQEHSHLQSKWQTGTPPTLNNDFDYYIVAVRRSHDQENVYVFPAAYANNYDGELQDQDGIDYIANGWYDDGADHDGTVSFVPTLENGDEVLGWQPMPKYRQ